MKNILILMVSLALSGCAVVQPTDPYPPMYVPSHAVSVRLPAVSAANLPERTMTLQQAIEIGLANNPDVVAAEWDAVAAQARQEHAFGERLPKISLIGEYNHHLDEQRLLPVRQPGDPAILSRDIFSEDIVVSLPLFTGGRLTNQWKAANLLKEAAAHGLARTREELVFNISSVFFSILAQRHVIESLEFSRKTLEEHVKRIDALIAAQKAARVDRMRTEVRLADIQQQLVRDENLILIQRRLFANLLGLEDAIENISLGGGLGLQNSSILPELEEALAAAWYARDDYLAARATLEAQARNVDIARAGHWPTVSLQGAYGGRWAAGATTGTGDEFGDVGSVAIVMEIPLYEGGRINADVREQRAELAAAQERLRRLELQVRLEIETALLNVESSSERAAAIQKSIAQAKESLRIEEQKYNLGKGTIVDVLDAQAALLESETTYYRVLAEYHTAMAQLKLAMGAE